MVNDLIDYPIIQAPMAGGVSTPQLAAEVSNSGGLGFLAGGYKTSAALREDIANLRKLTGKAFGVNIFVPGSDTIEEEILTLYKKQIEAEAINLGTKLGNPEVNDDDWLNKIKLVKDEKIPVVSFTFGCPAPGIIKDLQEAGCYIIITVTTPHEAKLAAESGADALCVQGIEAGGHRSSFSNNGPFHEDYGLLGLLSLIRKEIDLPLIAAGGLMHGRDIAAVLLAGASAAQLGTAFLRCPESGANRAHKEALVSPRFKTTAVTRALLRGGGLEVLSIVF